MSGIVEKQERHFLRSHAVVLSAIETYTLEVNDMLLENNILLLVDTKKQRGTLVYADDLTVVGLSDTHEDDDEADQEWAQTWLTAINIQWLVCGKEWTENEANPLEEPQAWNIMIDSEVEANWAKSNREF